MPRFDDEQIFDFRRPTEQSVQPKAVLVPFDDSGMPWTVLTVDEDGAVLARGDERAQLSYREILAHWLVRVALP